MQHLHVSCMSVACSSSSHSSYLLNLCLLLSCDIADVSCALWLRMCAYTFSSAWMLCQACDLTNACDIWKMTTGRLQWCIAVSASECVFLHQKSMAAMQTASSVHRLKQEVFCRLACNRQQDKRHSTSTQRKTSLHHSNPAGLLLL